MKKQPDATLPRPKPKPPEYPASLTGLTLGETEFQRFRELIESELGIKMPPSKKTLLQSRFQRRLRQLGMGSYQEYCDYVFSPQGLENERPHLYDAVTTNTTQFFREPRHFEFLTQNVLPELAPQAGSKGVRIWSAGCSSGQEPYTLAMVLSEYEQRHSGFLYHILATDISIKILQHAVRAVYTLDAAKDVPQSLVRKYMLKSKDPKKRVVKMASEVRAHITFRRMNFMEQFQLEEDKDVIFCRNVVIYFDRPTQETLFAKFCNHLKPGGYLFIGHSESLSGMDLPLKQVIPTVFKRI